MTICLILIGDGRDEYRNRTTASADAVLPEFDQIVYVDDRSHLLGFAGAIDAAWGAVRTDFVFHLEADFVFKAPVPLARMLSILQSQPQLAQIALKRQPWNAEERAAGGIVELHPDDFVERSDGGELWTEHRRFFTTNPSVYSSRLCRLGWPQEEHSEGKFTHRLLEDPHLRFAFFGGKFDAPLVEHIGAERVGHGY
jgi:hypothetical protein